MNSDIHDGSGPAGTRRFRLSLPGPARRALLLSACLALVSCGDDTTSPTPPAARTPATITLEPGTVRLEVGDTVRIRASVLDDRGEPIADAAVAWTSSDPSVASVDATGLVRGVGAGAASISATSGSARAMAAATVLGRSPGDRATLVKLYEALDGANWYQNTNWLSEKPVGEWYGVEADSVGRVLFLDLAENDLFGPLPAEIGNLRHLQGLDLSYNFLSGSIPPEIGNLPELFWLFLDENEFTGPIPGDIGRLAKLEELYLGNRQLSGPLPPELGNLGNLVVLSISNAGVEGRLPAEVGRLSSLASLRIQDTGIGGMLPAALAGLPNLEELALGGNRFSGAVPPEFGRSATLRSLHLFGNADLSGPLPASFASSSLRNLTVHGTGLCAPEEPAFRTFVHGLIKHRVPFCGDGSSSAAILTQATQSREFPVPLVAGEAALLRVFVTASRATAATLPPVRATFFVDGAEVHVAEIPAGTSAIPTEVQVGRLDLSANARIPAEAIRPGLEMVVEVDPQGTVDASLGVAKRIPAEGRAPVDVRTVPPLHLTLVPFVSSEDNDRGAVQFVERVTREDPALWMTGYLLPVGAFEIEKHASVMIDSRDIGDVLQNVELMRAIENGAGHWAGLLADPDPETGQGVATVPGKAFASDLDPVTIAHELGHNLSLDHADCGDAAGPDPSFPWPMGQVGTWGFDARGDSLVSSETADLMSYCTPPWISDYNFANSLRFRIADTTEVRADPVRTLVVSGRIAADGALRLDPAFVFDAAPSLPAGSGPYRLAGLSADGSELFSIRFDRPRVADGDGGAGFVYAVPAEPEWAGELAGLMLSGPAGAVEMREGSAPPVAIARDARTGEVRTILRHLPSGSSDDAGAVATAHAPGLEVLVSTGLPDASQWGR